MGAESVSATAQDIRVITISLFIGGIVASYFTNWVQSRMLLTVGSLLLLAASVQIKPRADTTEASHFDIARFKGYLIIAIAAFVLANAV